MAKGRRHGLNHQERLLGSFSYVHSHTDGADLPDLGEEDVWSAMAADDAGGDGEGSGEEGWYGDAAWATPRGVGGGGDGGGRRAHRDPAAHGRRCQVGGLSLAFEDGGDPNSRVIHQYCNMDNAASWQARRRHQMAASAPVNVPDWTSIRRADSAESPPGHAEFDGEDVGWMPPHEYLAREYAMSGRTAANSVFEGVGRTLKGRDMRRLRDAVWSQTGFNG